MVSKQKRHKSEPKGKFAAIPLSFVDTPAWRPTSTSAQAFYPWSVMEFKGKTLCNSSQIKLNVR